MSATAPGPGGVPGAYARSGPFWLATTAALALLLVAALRALDRPGSPDATYVVLPVAQDQRDPAHDHEAWQGAALLYEALARWEGIRLVDPLRARDFTARRGSPPRSVESARAAARQLGASMLFVAAVDGREHTLRVRAALYETTGNPLPLRQHGVDVRTDFSDAGPKFVELADALLTDRASAGTAMAGGFGTTSVAAWQAFEQGRAALFAWDLADAERALRSAVWLDPNYPDAHLWLAQSLAWAGRPPGEWRAASSRAFDLRHALPSRDRLLAQALVSLANGAYQDACATYRELVARDSLDFAGWYGLGACNADDPRVLPDDRSPSGWKFRGGYHTAAEAYARALRIVPSTHYQFRGPGLQRLTSLLRATGSELRTGFAVTPDTIWFGAIMGWEGDTASFVPFPLAEVLAAAPGAVPSSVRRAIERSRERLRLVATDWIRAFPRSADAHEALGLALEYLGMVDDARSEELSALAQVRRARRLATDSQQVLRLEVLETRLLVKRREFATAARHAAGTLAAYSRQRPADAGLAGAAALMGRIELAASQLAVGASSFVPTTPEGASLRVPEPLAEAALRLQVYAASGAYRDQVTALTRRVEEQVQQHVPPSQRDAARFALLDQPAWHAYADLGPSPVHRPAAGSNYLLEIQSALANGDTALARSRLDRAHRGRLQSGVGPRDMAIDQTFDEARLLLALGDTAVAVQLLDGALTHLAQLPASLLDRVPEAISLMRAMALRADLADRAGDRATARLWALPVTALWENADPQLQPVVRRMRALAATP